MNSNLIGVGTVYNLTHRLSLNAEVETQWLPKSDIPTADLCGGSANAGCPKGAQQDYYRWSTQWTFAYDFGIQNIFGEPIRVQYAAQPSFTYEHGNTSDSNGLSLGNFLALDATQGASNSTNCCTAGTNGNLGTFGVGAKMYAFQTGPTFQFHNAFLRPTIAYTRLASVSPGFGYGSTGTAHDQVVLMLDFGWLLGQQEDTNSGQH